MRKYADDTYFDYHVFCISTSNVRLRYCDSVEKSNSFQYRWIQMFESIVIVSKS